jgi:hypothetical protein
LGRSYAMNQLGAMRKYRACQAVTVLLPHHRKRPGRQVADHHSLASLATQTSLSYSATVR